ncbi:hypothetical protein BCR44DRAFT_115730 [Catenaria anguillulae PL171]|uniref:Uncharacterized protein n=1 Tax=Catenaria anguillulae PL171 TaxID=765915 RepID=A0A1Y2HM03_9FUNG|nr:hypothetical protein BCR44DRAFT_115730 [Catenaria anguillulae PL171]
MAEQKLAAALEVVESLRGERTRAVAALKLAEQQLALMAQERDEIEQAHEQTVRRWQRELETKCRELEDVASRIPKPEDLQRAKDGLIQEVHSQVKEEMERLKDEARQAGQAAELLREENRTVHSELAALVRRCELETSHQKEKAALLIRIRDLEHLLETKSPSISRDEAVCKLQAQVSEYQLKHAHLLAENEDLRAIKTDLTSQLDNESRANARAQLELKSTLESVRVDRDLLQSKLQRAHEEQQTLINKTHEQTQHIAEIQVELAAARRALDEHQHHHSTSLFSIQSEHAQEKLKWERERRDLQARVDSLARELAGAHRALEDVRTERRLSNVRDVEATKANQQAMVPESTHRQAVEELQAKIKSLNGLLDEQHVKHLGDKESLIRRIQELKSSLDDLQHEHAQILRQRDSNEASAERAQDVEEELRGELDRTRLRLESTLDELAALRESEAWIRPQFEEAQRRIKDLNEQVEDLRSALVTERESHFAAMKEAKAVWVKSHQDLTRQLDVVSSEYAQLKENHGKLKAGAQTRMHGYRASISALESKLKTIETKYLQVQTELSSRKAREELALRESSHHQKEFLEFLRRELHGNEAGAGGRNSGHESAGLAPP